MSKKMTLRCHKCSQAVTERLSYRSSISRVSVMNNDMNPRLIERHAPNIATVSFR